MILVLLNYHDYLNALASSLQSSSGNKFKFDMRSKYNLCFCDIENMFGWIKVLKYLRFRSLFCAISFSDNFYSELSFMFSGIVPCTYFTTLLTAWHIYTTVDVQDNIDNDTDDDHDDHKDDLETVPGM